ncbi:50S ribosomal protein L11 [Ureaplasma sp. ES3154-GEN]|uniref:50S ribosomal protein L11 n=1 Tax=Ureaplasma sp. ES3154-GEN TaxID=2984844 RepID=UPI0021E96064|nr:50S ribosomal protein L11 [Ureaplasma sp. ES3154-GEN]MCV3743824.1 50S ribosomal protein L11 [Ureaplasma sp. ES3154-GEN]
MAVVKKKKEVTRIAKLNLIGNQAKPGPALASVGINMAEFTRAFNDKTKDQNGKVIPVVITAYKDKSFDFVVKTTPVAYLLKEAANIQSGAKDSKKQVVATISKEKALEIARYKLVDMTAYDEETALGMVAGSAKQMGIKIEGYSPYKADRE